MEKSLLIFFFILAFTSPFLYRFVRLGKFAWFVKKGKLNNDQNYKNAEQFRFLQILLGFICLVFHGSLLWGWYNIILYVSIASGIGFFMEIIGSRTGLVFGGKYKFESSKFQGPIYAGIPLLIPLSWAGLIYMSLNYCMFITGYDFFDKPMLLFFLSSFLLTVFDVILDPIAVDEGRWKWDEPGSFYNVPIYNFFGWFFTIFIILWLFKFLIFRFWSENSLSLIFQYSPSFLFVILPAIASRPCFERGLRKLGFFGLLLTVFMLLLAILRYLN
ncbi:MAG: carotenoid biosynthesis protein [Candidatus Neomarinimicrobiota bacterium]